MRRSVASLGALALALAGCRGEQSMLDPAGPGAEMLARMGWFVFVLFTAIAVVMWALIYRVATRRPGTLAEHAPPDAGGGQRWIVWGGFAIPGVILATVFILALTGMDAFPLHDASNHGPADIRVEGHQWWWEVAYLASSPDETVSTANEIHIPVGRPIDIELTSADVIHSFWVPKLHGKVDLVPGHVNRIRIQADRPGVFRGECAEFCGAQHAHMILLVVAESEEDHAEWIARQRRPAAAPVTAAQMRGQQLFETRACGLCHTIRGTRALGTVGPDLTHLASRRGLAANSLPNKTAYLAAWVTHAQSLKPGAQMPNVTQFDGEDLRALVQYLEALR